VNDRWYSGLQDIEGTFTGLMDMADGATLLETADGTPVTFWAPKNLPWWQHWIALARERLFGTPYPQEIVFSGFIGDVTTTYDEDGSMTAEGRITR